MNGELRQLLALKAYLEGAVSNRKTLKACLNDINADIANKVFQEVTAQIQEQLTPTVEEADPEEVIVVTKPEPNPKTPIKVVQSIDEAFKAGELPQEQHDGIMERAQEVRELLKEYDKESVNIYILTGNEHDLTK